MAQLATHETSMYKYLNGMICLHNAVAMIAYSMLDADVCEWLLARC